MLAWLIVRAIHYFDPATFEERELKAFPRGTLFNRGIGIQHLRGLWRELIPVSLPFDEGRELVVTLATSVGVDDRIRVAPSLVCRDSLN